MMKKLRNQPYAPKWEQAPKWGSKEEEKNTQFIIKSNYNGLTGLHTLKITVTAVHI
jgi:hypothetical protein